MHDFCAIHLVVIDFRLITEEKIFYTLYHISVLSTDNTG